MDLDTIVQAATKSTLGAVIVGLMYGVSLVIKEWRGGSASEKEQAGLAKRVTDLETRLNTAEAQITALTRTVHDLRYQRDQARLRVEFLELAHGVQPPTVWPADPEES